MLALQFNPGGEVMEDREKNIREQAENKAYRSFEQIIDKEDTEYLLSVIDSLRVEVERLI